LKKKTTKCQQLDLDETHTEVLLSVVDDKMDNHQLIITFFWRYMLTRRTSIGYIVMILTTETKVNV